MTPKDFFFIWVPFCADLSDIWKREHARIVRETTKKLKQKQVDNKKEMVVVKKPKAPGGLKARLGR